MRKTQIIYGLLLMILPLVSQAQLKPPTLAQKDVIVQISTDMGTINLKLYNETPGHRDNFIKLVKEGKLEGSIFHRVIEGFMIQGGGSNRGSESFGDPFAPEFNEKFYHKKGALAAARMGDDVNPGKKSSGSQFYIVQGRVYLPEELDNIQTKMNKTFTDEQKKEYITKGGAPHLDGDYSVFGEVIEGMNIVDKIAKVEKTKEDPSRPLKDIPMKVTILE